MKLVLIVEDEYGNAEVMQLLLEAEGYRVAVASNGRQALEILRNGEQPALILSDYMMPIMNGGEFGAAIKQDPALSQIPFVFMSGTNEEVVRRVFQAYDAFLAKPVELEPLLAVLQSLMADAPQTQAQAERVQESMRQVLEGMRVPPRD
ncbi:response regulator [Acidovorax sp.]|uniref:response regulator n=1 Tax=Acidovorax sp. TaxID=1872122 RepID=UPI00391A8F41